MDLAEQEVRSPSIHEALRYWRGRIPPGQRVPPRRHIDPLDMPRLLPAIIMLDVHRDPLRFEIRLAGTAIREIYAAELTGITIAADDASPLSTDAYPRLMHAVNEAAPVFARNAVHWQGRDHVRYDVAHLPLGADDRIEKILTLIERV